MFSHSVKKTENKALFDCSLYQLKRKKNPQKNPHTKRKAIIFFPFNNTVIPH